MDDRSKCEIYTKLLKSLNKNGELKEEISTNTYNSQIKLIKTNLLSNVNSDQETALQMIKILIENNVQNIQRDIITILSDESVARTLKIVILDSCKNYLKDLLLSNNITDLASLYVHWKIFDLQKFDELLANACSEKSLDDSQSEPINFAILLIEQFLPIILSHNINNMKQPLIEVATKIAEMNPVSNLNAEEYQDFLNKVPGFLTNLVNLQQSDDNVWKEALHFLTKYLDDKLHSPEVQEIFNNSSLNWKLVQTELESNINIELAKSISENDLVVVARLFCDWKLLDFQKFTTALKEVCHDNDYNKYCKVFLFEKLIPVIMAPKDIFDLSKVQYIELALEFASALPITKLSNEEYNKFIGNVNDYIKNISDLRDMNFEHWHKLWMFLVRLFGKKLHHSMTLINRLLRVVEHAFRNSSYEQRLRGYDCWKELIDNVSLDSHHISSEKQIRLLLTPLRAKFSKQEAVIVKRFEVFVYLIEKLQDKAVLVLKEFLEFCFGEVGEDTDPNKAGQGKNLPELWLRSAKVVLAILGHSHDSNEHCLETNSEIHLTGAILNSNNISTYCHHVINSVAESCILLKEVELENKNTVINCFWSSLLRIILDDEVASNETCIKTFDKVLDKLIKDNDPYCKSIAAEIFKSTIQFEWSKISALILYNLKHFIGIIFSVPLNTESYLDIEKFQIMVCTLESAEVTLKIIHTLFECFTNYKTLDGNANFVAKFWIFLANELDEYAKNKCLYFLVWPAQHLHHVTDSAKEVLIYEHYERVVSKFVEKSDELHFTLFKQFEKILKNNPFRSKNILTLVTTFTPKTENKEITNITLDILDLIMVVPATDDSSKQRQNLGLYLKKFYESNITNIQDHDTIKKLCICVKHTLKFKHYDILSVVEESLKSLPENIKWVHGKFFSLDFLMDLFEKETDVHASEKIHKLIEVFRNLKNPETKKDITSFMPLGGRSAKIAKLVKQIPPSPGKQSHSPSTLRLFGKDIGTHSPLKVKGSQLKDMKDTPTKTKASTPTQKPKKTMFIDDESNSKFVFIESEVKIDKDKLTEHQKEALKKRREDIPALYQDLSQSMTRSLDTNFASSKTEEGCEIFKQPEDVEIKNKSDETESDKGREKAKSVEDAISKDFESSVNNSSHVTTDKSYEPQNEISDVDKSRSDTLETESQNKDLTTEELKKTAVEVELKKTAVETELKKLSMSIVGAEEFLATNSKRKRREKNRDQEESKERKPDNEEKKSKVSHGIKLKVGKGVSTDVVQENEGKEIPAKDNNELEKTEEVGQVRKRGCHLKRKSISNKQNVENSSLGETAAYVPTAESDSHSAVIKNDNIPDKSTQVTDMDSKVVIVIKKRGRRMRRKNISSKNDSCETPSTGESDNEIKIFEDGSKLSVHVECSSKDETEQHVPNIESDVDDDDDDQNIIKPDNTAEATNMNTKEAGLVKKRGWPLGMKRKSISVKKNSPETLSKGDNDNETKTSEEHFKLPPENHSTGESVDDTAKCVPSAETDKNILVIKTDNKPDAINIDSKEGSPIKRRGRSVGVKRKALDDKKDSPESPVKSESDIKPKNINIIKKRGWPLGVKRRVSGKRDTTGTSGNDQSPVRNLMEHQSETTAQIVSASMEINILENNKVDKSPFVKDDSNSIKYEKDSGTKRRKRRVRTPGGKHIIVSSKSDGDGKPVEEMVKTEHTDLDVYEFDTEQEKASESEIIPLRSPIKDISIKLKIDVKDNLKHFQITSTHEDKKKRARKSHDIADTSKVEGSAFSGRKSRRKIVLTERFTQSELFKPSEQTPESSRKAISSSSKVSHSNNEEVEKLTQSELFKQTDTENRASENLTMSSVLPSELTENNEVYQEPNKEVIPFSEKAELTGTVKLKLQEDDTKIDIVDKSVNELKIEPITDNEKLKSNENVLRKAIKRKRSSSEEDDDDDVIESSQTSTISNISTAKLRRSLGKISSCDNHTSIENKQNIIKIKETEDVFGSNPLDPTQVDDDTVKAEVTPEEKKQRRGRLTKSPIKNSSSYEDTNIHDNSQDKLFAGVQKSNESTENQSDNRTSDAEVTPEEKSKRRLRPPKSPAKNYSASSGTSGFEGCHIKLVTEEQKQGKSAETQSNNDTTKVEVVPEERKLRRGRPPKSPAKNDSSFAETSTFGDCQAKLFTGEKKLDKSAETQSDNDTTKVELTPEKNKSRRLRPIRSPAKNDALQDTSCSKSGQNQFDTVLKKGDKCIEQAQSDSDISKVEITPEDIKGKRGRRKKSPAKTVALLDSQNPEAEGSEESQSLITIIEKSSGVTEGTAVDISNTEEGKSRRPRRKTKEDSDTIQSTNLVPIEKDKTVPIDEPKPKRKRHRKTADELELLEEINDGYSSGDSIIHILEAVDRTASGSIKSAEKLKQGRRKSPRNSEKEPEELIEEIMQKVKKQVFPEKFKEPTDLDISIQNFKHRTQSQDTQTQESVAIIDGEIQLQLDLPQKPVLTETDMHIARMDTASLPLDDLVELKGFDISNNEKTTVESNKTLIDSETLSEEIAESVNIINSSEETKEHCNDINIIMNEKAEHENELIPKEKSSTGAPETESIVSSSEDNNSLEELNEITEIADTEEIRMEVLSIDVQQTVEVDNTSPVKEQMAGNCIGTPGPLETSLPSSPVTGDTPNRTSELLNCTSDISPIGSKSGSDKSSSDDEFVEQRKLVPVALKFDNEDTDHEANKEKSPEKADDAPEKIDEMSPDKAEKEVDQATSSSPPKDEARTSRDVRNITERSSRFFDMIKSGSPATHRVFSKRKACHNMSPSASRIKKLMSNVKAPSQSEFTDDVGQDDILTFTREVPSPLALPRSSILKRKHSETADDGMSPCAKRKRVNFSDPCTTSKKIFIKEDNRTSQCLFRANSDDELDKQFLEVLAANNIIDAPQTESDNIETEQSLQVNNPFLLRDDTPIYPDLGDCDESVSIISRKLTSPMFVNALLSKLNSKNIKTIGDLARQSEVSIARLPFKTPMVANVYKALDNYYHKNFKSKVNKEKCETRINGEQEADNEIAAPLARLEVALVKMDVKQELLKVLERAKSQKISSEMLCSLLFSFIDEKDGLTYIRTHFNLETKDIVEEKDFPKIVKHITETVGLPKIFEILTESLESSEDESVYFDCMIRHSIEKKPLSSLIEKRSLQELQAALWQNVENELYTKKELLNICFLPFVNSIDLSPFFNKMTVVQIEDIVTTRLKTEDYIVFIKRILKKCSSNPQIKDELLNHCTVSELTSTIIRKGSSKEVMSSFTYMFLSADKDKEDLVQIFRLVSDSLVSVLPPSKLMELSMEFLRKIPIKD